MYSKVEFDLNILYFYIKTNFFLILSAVDTVRSVICMFNLSYFNFKKLYLTHLVLKIILAWELKNQTIISERIATELPKDILSLSVAAEGFRNILTLKVSQIDSVQVE